MFVRHQKQFKPKCGRIHCHVESKYVTLVNAKPLSSAHNNEMRKNGPDNSTGHCKPIWEKSVSSVKEVGERGGSCICAYRISKNRRIRNTPLENPNSYLNDPKESTSDACSRIIRLNFLLGIFLLVSKKHTTFSHGKAGKIYLCLEIVKLGF